MEEHSVVSKLSAQYCLKAHIQNVNSRFSTKSLVKVSGLSIIYLLECNLCKIQYVEKSKGRFNIDLKNQGLLSRQINILLYQAINTNAKFILIEQLTNRKNTPTETLKEKLKNRENFNIIKLKVLTPLIPRHDHLVHLQLQHCIMAEDL